MTKINLIIIYGLLGVLGVFVGYQYYKGQQQDAYILSEKVFSEFAMTKELESKFRGLESQRKGILDSLEFDLTRDITVIRNGNRDKAFIAKAEEKREYFLQKKQEFADDNQRITNSYNQTIWERINQYVKTYAEAKGYKYVWGANGNGTLMFADESKNITDDIIKYINEEYNGN